MIAIIFVLSCALFNVGVTLYFKHKLHNNSHHH